MKPAQIFVLLLLCAALVNAQRGGGGRSGGRSRSVRSFRSGGASRSRDSYEGKSGKTPPPEAGQMLVVIIWLVTGTLVISCVNVICLACCCKSQRARKKIKILAQLQAAANKRQHSIFSPLSPMAKSLLKDRWVMRYYSQGNPKPAKAMIDVESATIKSNNTYALKFHIWDPIGTSVAEGLLVYKDDKLAMMFEKKYNNKLKANQREPYDTLMYEGEGSEGEGFRGKWYYMGFQDSRDYSGKWSMSKAKPRTGQITLEEEVYELLPDGFVCEDQEEVPQSPPYETSGPANGKKQQEFNKQKSQ